MMITGKMAGVGVAVSLGALKSILEVLSDSDQRDQLLRLMDKEISLPNINFPTLGGHVFWTDIVELNGWRIQRNGITQHARILDNSNVRIAWGTVNGMCKVWGLYASSDSRHNNLNSKNR